METTVPVSLETEETAVFPSETEEIPETETLPTPQLRREPEDEDFVRVKDYIPDIAVELRYAGDNNFTGKVIYSFSDAYLRYGTVKKLAAAQEELKAHNVFIKIWDAFRPVSGQQALWDACPDPDFVSPPDTGGRPHCRGNAIDITLVDASGQELEMPTEFDEFSDRADRNYSDCTEAAANNARFLEELMGKYGFSGYSREWWHYNDTFRYPIDFTFDPALISSWRVNCQEYLTLRREADTGAEPITWILAGETVTLLGHAGDFALVEYDGQQGYVLRSYLEPVNE